MFGSMYQFQFRLKRHENAEIEPRAKTSRPPTGSDQRVRNNAIVTGKILWAEVQVNLPSAMLGTVICFKPPHQRVSVIP
jgi:hypothetical protein